jgi:hypothetical protein
MFVDLFVTTKHAKTTADKLAASTLKFSEPDAIAEAGFLIAICSFRVLSVLPRNHRHDDDDYDDNNDANDNRANCCGDLILRIRDISDGFHSRYAMHCE